MRDCRWKAHYSSCGPKRGKARTITPRSRTVAEHSDRTLHLNSELSRTWAGLPRGSATAWSSEAMHIRPATPNQLVMVVTHR